MSQSRFAFVCSLAAVSALVAACGPAPIPAPPPLTAEQMNANARPSPDDLMGGPPIRAAQPAVVETPPEPPAPPTASVRVIHASPERAAAQVDVYVGTNGTPAAQALAYKSGAGPVTVPTGEQAIAVRAAGAANDAPPVLSGTSPALEAGRTYTVIAHGLAGGAQPALALAAAADDDTAPESGQGRVRLFHAVAGLAAVDVCTPPMPARPASSGRLAVPAQPARVVFENVSYGTFTPYAAVPAGSTLVLQFRARGARPCAGAVRGSVTLAPEGSATLVATGRVATGANNVPRVVLVCPQGGEGTRCTETAVR